MRVALFALMLCVSTQAHAMSPREIFMEQVHNFWGTNLIEEDLDIITGDLNNDGTDDTIGWQVIKDEAGDYYFEMMAVVNSKKYGVQTANVRIPIDSNVICTHVPFVGLSPWNEQEMAAHSDLKHVSPNAIRINGGPCQTIHLFWPLNTPHATVDLRMPRN